MGEQSQGLLHSARNLLDTALGLLQTRIELLATEIEEEKGRLLGVLVFGATAFVLLVLGIVFVAITLTVLLWDEHRLLILVLFSSIFLFGAGAALILAVHNARPRERLFAASLDEIKQDRAALRGEK